MPLFYQRNPIIKLFIAITNHHKLCGLKQHKCILFAFWRSEVCSQFHWVKIKVSSWLCSSSRLWGDIVSLPFLASDDHLSSRRVALPASLCHHCFILLPCPLATNLPQPPPYKDPCDSTLGPHRESRIISPCRGPSLAHICKVPLTP